MPEGTPYDEQQARLWEHALNADDLDYAARLEAERDQDQASTAEEDPNAASDSITLTDFQKHRIEIAADNSPHGPIRSREVAVNPAVVGTGIVPGRDITVDALHEDEEIEESED